MASGIATTPVLLGGNRYAAVLRLAAPTVVAMLSQSVVNEVDVIFFKHLPYPESSNAQAALLPSLLLVWIFGGSLSAISVGTQALVARRYAERSFHGAGAVLANAAWFALIAGALLTVVGQLALPSIVRVTTDVPEKAEIMNAYARWRLFGVISMGGTMAVKAFFDGIGKTYVHLVSALVMNAFNILFCWMFIFGKLGAPRMGAPGAGFAAFAATWIGLFIMLGYAWMLRDVYRPVRWANLSRSLTWTILKLSIPAALATVTMGLGFLLFQKAADMLDIHAVPWLSVSTGAVPPGTREAVNSAATTDIVAVLKLTFTACIGFGTATATLVGQSLGAKQPDEASKYGWTSVRLGLVIFGVIGLCEALFASQIIHFISDSEAVQHAAIVPMRMMGVITPIIAVVLILSEALFGAGNPKFVAVAQLLMVFFVLVPGAYVLGLALDLGLTGVWAAVCVYATIGAAAMSVKFARGGWKKIVL